MAKKPDPRKAKERKQKIVAAIGGLILLVVLVIQGPTIMKQLSGGPKPSAAPARPATTTTTTSATGTPTLAPPSLAGGQQASTGTTGASTPAQSTSSGVQEQLTSFSEFATKDPFAQQLTAPTSTTSSSGSSGSSSKPSSGSGGSSGGAAPAPGTAVISVNGTLMTVTVGTDFPQPTTTSPGAQPYFHLVSLTAHSARISIAGGSYASGAAAVTLRENKPVTLVNTADGTRYRLILKPVGTAVPAPPAATTTTTQTTTTGG